MSGIVAILELMDYGNCKWVVKWFWRHEFFTFDTHFFAFHVLQIVCYYLQMVTCKQYFLDSTKVSKHLNYIFLWNSWILDGWGKNNQKNI